MSCNYVNKPIRMPNNCQLWHATELYPYPMNFMEAPSAKHQVYVTYNGNTMLQGLDRTRGPMMWDCNAFQRSPIKNCSRSKIMYPTTHSYPDPFQQSYINLARKCRKIDK